MIGTETLRAIADLGGLGVLALFILTTGVVTKLGIDLFKSQVLPMARNHLEHLEEGYARLADSLDGLKAVQKTMVDALELHNELTRDLVSRLPKNNVKRLLD